MYSVSEPSGPAADLLYSLFGGSAMPVNWEKLFIIIEKEIRANVTIGLHLLT